MYPHGGHGEPWKLMVRGNKAPGMKEMMSNGADAWTEYLKT